MDHRNRTAPGLTFDESRRRHERARALTPGGVHSNVRLRESPWPLHFESAEGVRLRDADGNTLLDFALGQGPLLLGHRPPEVVEAVQKQLERGILYAGQHDLEDQVAELVEGLVPCAERLRFSVTGSEAVQAALRMARAATGRSKVLKFQGHYHGWADTILYNVGTPGPVDPKSDLLGLVAESEGLAASAGEGLYVVQWNDESVLRRVLDELGDQVAAVIMEPVMANTGGVIPPVPGYLEAARRLCDKYGILLIFDEVITGFRLHPGGAQARFGVTPDLAVFGKAIASGFPVSCVAGRADVLDTVVDAGVNHSGTFNAYPLGLAAAAATLTRLADPHNSPYEEIGRVGARLIDGLCQAAGRSPWPLLVQGFPQLLATTFTRLPAIRNHADVAETSASRLRLFMTALVSNGVRPTSRGTWMVSAAHTDADVDEALESIDRAIAELAVHAT